MAAPAAGRFAVVLSLAPHRTAGNAAMLVELDAQAGNLSAGWGPRAAQAPLWASPLGPA